MVIRVKLTYGAVYFDFLPLSNTNAETPMARTNVDVLLATEW